jgi:hypothetical protein
MQLAVQLLRLLQLWVCSALVDRSGEAKNCLPQADHCDADAECNRCTSAYEAPADPPALTCSQVVDYMRRSFPSNCDIGKGVLHDLSVCVMASALQGSGIDCQNYEITSTESTAAPTAAPSAAPTTSAPFAAAAASRELLVADGDAASASCNAVQIRGTAHWDGIMQLARWHDSEQQVRHSCVCAIDALSSCSLALLHAQQ